jgi:hypothetical protein
MTTEELTKNADLEKIAKEGSAIYEKIKDSYISSHHGQFLSIDIGSQDVFVATTSAEAVVLARQAHPNTVFYVVKIGFDAAETMAHLFPEK